MRVELKNVKFYERLSEETNCFTATVYIDGKKAGECENRGTGGSTNVHFLDHVLRDAFHAYARSLPDVLCKARPEVGIHEDWSYKMSGDHLIDELFDAWLKQKESKKLARMEAKCKADFAKAGFPVTVRLEIAGATAWTACKSTEDAQKAVEMYEAKSKSKVISFKIV